MSNRFDNRTKEEFAKDIKFGTMIENKWMEYCFPFIKKSGLYTNLSSYKENGVDNTGEFQKKSNGNADFMLCGETETPLEVKWCPTSGKISFKIADMLNYLKQQADILITYNMGFESLKQPKHADYEKHWKKILEDPSMLRWGIIKPKDLYKIMINERLQNIWYMGNKPGFILKEKKFSEYFKLRKFT